MDGREIGVFDSGLGGLSSLRDMMRLLPLERFVYYGDNLNAPYGVLPEEEIRKLTFAVVEKLLSRNVKALVIACNTMTSAAAAPLRSRLTIPLIGMEPALKPASLSHGKGRILVLATEATLRQEKFKKLYEKYGRDAICLPCPRFVELVEADAVGSAEAEREIADTLSPYRGAGIDALVLGCTHFVFLKDSIARALPGVEIFDGNEGTARRLKSLLGERGALSAGPGGLTLLSSDPAALPRMEKLLRLNEGRAPQPSTAPRV